MRSPLLFVLLVTAFACCGAAHAAPIPGDYLQGQFAAKAAQDLFPVDHDPTLNTSFEASNLFSRAEADTKPMFGINQAPQYLTGSSGPFNILANTSAPLPEPPSLLLLGSGILGLAVVWRYRRSKA